MLAVPRVLVVVAIAAVAAVGPAAGGHAASSGTVITGPNAEAWYRKAPICALPVGCPAAPSMYPPDTLHVGVNLGQEEARTLLQLDLTSLAAGTTPTGGELRLPLATGARDGTRNPQGAKLRACLVNEAVRDVDGSFEKSPEADCDSASVDALFVPATPDAPAAFTVDLAALAIGWKDSAAPGALALVPAQNTAPPDSWHVALSDRTRQGEGVAKISAVVSFADASDAAVEAVEAPSAPVQAPADPGFGAPVPLAPVDTTVEAPGPALDASLAAPAPAPAAPPVGPAPQAAPPAVVPVAAVIDASFRYPAVFLLPLLFAVAAGWLGRALTRDLTIDQPVS